MKLFTTTETIITAIENVRKSGVKLDNMIQVAACSVINHVEKHGDITLVNTLLDAMPNGSRVNALRDFILTFGKVEYDEATKAMVYAKGKETDLEGAQNIMWSEFKPEAPYVAFDLNGLIQGILKKADKALKDDKECKNVDVNLLAALRQTVETAPELEGTL